ncbi:Centrin EF-hand protein 3 [Fasciolopsis buskii]|uniref:Centrin EF-hand protein 3 n=1 Tax=Fasciolopsis buskii TaxID=27845 RepID=A0A8E0RL79_9TREM|nr:Centrin EF-hand protein 3 [Fasciolopsis buski]
MQSPSNIRRRKRRELTPEQKQEIIEAFDLFDADHDQQISYYEFKVALRALGFELKKQEVLQILEDYNIKEDSGKLKFDEFNEIVSDMILDRDPTTEIIRAFKLFDDDDSGKITYRNLKKVARELGETLTDQELRAMIEVFDRDGDGAINLEEFMALMTKEI